MSRLEITSFRNRILALCVWILHFVALQPNSLRNSIVFLCATQTTEVYLPKGKHIQEHLCLEKHNHSCKQYFLLNALVNNNVQFFLVFLFMDEILSTKELTPLVCRSHSQRHVNKYKLFLLFSRRSCNFKCC